jgi:hypothetical protein
VDEQHARAVVVAIWPKLQAGEWGRVHTRDLDDHGDKPPFKSVCTATIPNYARTLSQHRIIDPLAIVATLPDGGTIILTSEAYEHVYALQMTSDEQREHYRILMGRRPPPYRWTTDRHGRKYLSTNAHGWDWNGSRHARTALDKIAEASTTLHNNNEKPVPHIAQHL